MIFYRYLLNPVMRGLLRSPFHGLASGNIGILHFTGRSSGRELNTPLSYMREGDTVRFLSNHNTVWWKNLRGGASVSVDAAGERLSGTATVLEGDSEALRAGVRSFINAVPRDARVYGMKLDNNKQLREDSLIAVANELVLVEVTLN